MSMGSELSVGMSRGGGGVVRARTGNTVAVWAAEGAPWVALLAARLRRREQCAQIGLDRLRLASKLQRGRVARDVYTQQVSIRQLCSHAPEWERDDTGGHLAHAKLQQQHAAIAALAHEALISFDALAPSRTLQKCVVAHPRHKLPAAVRAPGDILAADLEPRHAREHALDVGTRVEELIRAGQAEGIRTAQEFFADRNYTDEGLLVSRKLPDAVITDEDFAVARVVRAVKEGTIESASGKLITVKPDTICIHGDNVHALEFAGKIRTALTEAGVEVKPV